MLVWRLRKGLPLPCRLGRFSRRWQEREAVLKYRPLGLSSGRDGRLKLAEALRDEEKWREAPVEVLTAHWGFFQHLGQGDLHLERAIRVAPVDYRWRLGRWLPGASIVNGFGGSGIMTDEESLPLSTSGRTPRTVVEETVRQAGALIMSRFRGSVRVDYKGRGNVVTEVDLEVDRMVTGHLTREFPEWGLPSEESSSSGEARGLSVDHRPHRRVKEFFSGAAYLCRQPGAGPPGPGCAGPDL